MTTPQLLLSLFPGVDLLGRAFEATGYCVVRGPDLILDSHIEHFSVPPGRFDGIIGGPPCQHYSDANRKRDPARGDHTLREFLRVVAAASPTWFLIENVRNVPNVQIAGYHVQRLDITDASVGGRQKRLRHIQYGHKLGWIIRPPRTNGRRPVTPVVTCDMFGPHDRHARRLARQGFDAPAAPKLPLRSLTKAARARAIGNGVPWLVGLALARATATASHPHAGDCRCGCGRPVSALAWSATPACRKRIQRARTHPTRTVTMDPLDNNPQPRV